MRRRFTVGGYIVIGLIVIGLIASLKALFIPICVFGLIFLLYKFPPSRWGVKKNTTQSGQRSTKRKTKHATFRVIHGNKNSDTEDRPKYH
jgi:hypothetical protein